MKLVPALGCLALAVPVSAQTVPPSEAFRSELAAVPEMAVVPDTLAVAAVRLGFIFELAIGPEGAILPAVEDAVLRLRPNPSAAR
jgi:hypothetical protein